MNFIRLICLGLVAFLTIFGKKQQQSSGPRFGFEATTLYFDTVTEGSIVEKTFMFRNIGSAPLIIEDISVSCGCITPSWNKDPIMPGHSGKVTAHFNTAGKTGPQLKTLILQTNDPDAPKLALKGYVKPKE